MVDVTDMTGSSEQTDRTSPYGYIPTASVCLTATILFLILTLLHAAQAIYYTVRDHKRAKRAGGVVAREDGLVEGEKGQIGSPMETGVGLVGERGIQTIRYWWIFPTLVVGGSLETVGWAGRYWSSHDVFAQSPFLMQICCLILAPAFFSAYCYVLLGQCIRNLSTVSASSPSPSSSSSPSSPASPVTYSYSLLSPSAYMWVFIFADLVSLVVQAIGGGGAAIAFENNKSTKKSTNIMVAGILFQLFSMTIFVALGADFIFRALAHRPHKKQISLSRRKAAVAPDVSATYRRSSAGEEGKDLAPNMTASDRIAGETEARRRWKLLLCAVAFAALMIFIRGIYRATELLQGWSGYLISHQVYFNVLDFLPMVLCLACFNIIHPGWVLGSRLPGGKR